MRFIEMQCFVYKPNQLEDISTLGNGIRHELRIHQKDVLNGQIYEKWVKNVDDAAIKIESRAFIKDAKIWKRYLTLDLTNKEVKYHYMN